MGIGRDAAARSLQVVAESDRADVWISLVDGDALLAAADAVDAAMAAGEDRPLAGLTFAVKDNIDVAGMPTTAACPAYAYTAQQDAPSVRALAEAGALCVGKTNLDQFATGLVGTRSAYGAVRHARDPERIAGGSSSGSAVAVALGQVDIALGTDTAGSGRVPAALQGIVGMKATVGTVSTQGVVPACRSFDCVSVFAGDLDTAEAALAELTGPRGRAADRRPFPCDVPLAAPPRPVVARADDDVLELLAPERRRAYGDALRALEAAGCRIVEIDLAPFLAAGDLLYNGAFVAERYAAVGEFVDGHRDEVDPTVGAIISAAGRIKAADLVLDQARLADLVVQARAVWDDAGTDSLVLPTTTGHPTLSEVAADPVGVNVVLGRFTTFCNLLDMCAVAVPAGTAAGLPFGVSMLGPAFSDLVQIGVARLLLGFGPADAPGDQDLAPLPWQRTRRGHLSPPGIALAVVGAHLSGQPLNHQLTDRGARLLGAARTAPCYRLHALATDPPKPGLRRAEREGAAIEVEVWELAPARFADFVASIPSPMTIGTVLLEDGAVPGFLCAPEALEGASDITAHGGWRAYLDSAATRPASA